MAITNKTSIKEETKKVAVIQTATTINSTKIKTDEVVTTTTLETIIRLVAAVAEVETGTIADLVEMG